MTLTAPVSETHPSCRPALCVDCCVTLSQRPAAVSMWLVQSPELEGTKALVELLLAQLRAGGRGCLWKARSLKGKCVCVATGSVCCFMSPPSHLMLLDGD